MKININFFKGLGDALVCSPAIKQLKEEHNFDISVQGIGAHAIYQNNPYCSVVTDEDAKRYTPHDLLLKFANNRPIHQLEYPIHYFNMALGLNMQLKYNRCFLYMSHEEEKPTHDKPYILINPEYNNNFSVKKYHKWQEVIDLLVPYIDVIQVGLKREHKYKYTINASGQTNIRQLFTLALNAEVVIGGESFLNHICSAFNTPYICVASGFSPKNYYSYANTTILNKSHVLSCGSEGCCWKTQIQPLPYADPGITNKAICLQSLPITADSHHERITACMALISPEEIALAAMDYIDTE